MISTAELRPLRGADVPEAHDLAARAFADLAARERIPAPPVDAERGRARIAHLLDTDPAGAWVAVDDDDRLLGVALALIRDGLWMLSLLVVDPGAQSMGLGRTLLARAVAYGQSCRAGLILASSDARALRSYARAGFSLRPCLDAEGRVRRRELRHRPGVRAGRRQDLRLAAAVAQAVRGAAHGPDLGALLAVDGQRMLVLPERGFAVFRDAGLLLLVAHDEDAARRLLVATLHEIPEDGDFALRFITAEQPWAIELAVAAGLDLRPSGALCIRGETGPLAPYLPNGAYY